MKHTLSVLVLLISSSVFAQVGEAGGSHGRDKHHRRPRHQQQQQQAIPNKKKVIRGKKAKKMFFEHLNQNGAISDSTNQCGSLSRKMRISGNESLRYAECFEFGEPNSESARYKCILVYREHTTLFRDFIFDLTHSICD